MDRRLRSLYVCYLSLKDPLVHTQVVAYLEGLVARGHVVHLLTYEGKLAPEQREAFDAQLAGRGITWHSLRYHKRPSLPATVYDALVGAVVAARLVRRHRLHAIHARNHVPAATALIARRLARCRLIFDMRGMMAEEYVDAGRWRAGGLAFRLTKRIEAAAIRAADAMVVLTERVAKHFFATRQSPPLAVIPCCADLAAIAAQHEYGAQARRDLDAGDRPILLYVGKFTGWYMEREMIEFFVCARAEIAGLLFVVLTQADPAPLIDGLEAQGIGARDYRITSVPAAEVGRYLAAADAGICFVRPCLSKISSSPTKLGEYLGGGLPVISGPGIGDVDDLLAQDGVGVLVPEFTPTAYRAAAGQLRTLLDDPATAGRCRALARRSLSLEDVGIPRYDRLYRRLADDVEIPP